MRFGGANGKTLPEKAASGKRQISAVSFILRWFIFYSKM